MPLDLPLSPTALKPAAKGMRQPEAGARRDTAAAAANALGTAEPNGDSAADEASDIPGAGSRSFAQALRKAQQPQDTDPSPKPGRHRAVEKPEAQAIGSGEPKTAWAGALETADASPKPGQRRAVEEPDAKAPWGHAWGHWRAPGQQDTLKGREDAEPAAPRDDLAALDPPEEAVDPAAGAAMPDPGLVTQPVTPVLPVLPPTPSNVSSPPRATGEAPTEPVSGSASKSAIADMPPLQGPASAQQKADPASGAAQIPVGVAPQATEQAESPVLATGIATSQDTHVGHAPAATTVAKPTAEGETDSPGEPSAPITLPLGLDRALDRAAPKAATGLARAAAALGSAGTSRSGDTGGDGMDRAGSSAGNAAAALNASGGATLAESNADPLAGAAAGAGQPAANAQNSAASPAPNAGGPSFATWLEHRLQDARSDAAAHPPVEVRVPTSVDDPRFTQNLGVQLATLARDGVSEARLHLHPADMGPISVQIAIDGTLAHLDLGASVEQTRQLLEQALPELATALRENGLTLSGGSVSDQARPFPGFGFGADGTGGSSGSAGSGAGNGRNESAGERGRPGDGDPGVDAATRNPERWRRVDGLLDTYA